MDAASESKRWYWKSEYYSWLLDGKFKGVPIGDFEGEEMIKALRTVVKSKGLENKRLVLRNAIRRKLAQYKGVEWVDGFPTKIPRRPFDYWEKFIY